LYEIYKEDNQLLTQPSVEYMATRISVFKERLSKQRNDVLQIAMDPSNTPEARIEAHKLAADIDWAILKLDYASPTFLARYFSWDNSIFVEDASGLNLKLKEKI